MTLRMNTRDAFMPFSAPVNVGNGSEGLHNLWKMTFGFKLHSLKNAKPLTSEITLTK